MAFNFQAFKTRALTAVIFVAVMLAGLLWNHWSFFILFSVIHFGCWFEFQKLVGKIDKDYAEISNFHRYGVMLAGWAIMLWMSNDAYVIGSLRLHELGWWMLLVCLVVLPIVEVLFSRTLNLKLIGYSLGGLIYISLSWGMMMELRGEGMLFKNRELIFDLGWAIPIILIASIWINDTMAYIVGSFVGKTPLSFISPKKTWEGTIGGAVLSVATIALVGHFWLKASMVDLIVISSIAAFFGTLGDLLESKLKRLADVKDSGKIMPGHGGFLDRFDSLILAVPIVWLYVRFLMY
ncbi:MAG TPA: phosphatidate cytidylyltransferase [Segetibacter sp.]|jgi:phosphatidate cytidylyltransferase